MITETAALLRTTVEQLRLVGGSIEFEAAAASAPAVMPAAFVIPLGEDPRPSQGANFIRQQIRTSLGVVLAVKNVADTKGEAAQADLTTLRIAVQAALLGWSPTDAEPLERGAGRLLGFKNSVLNWQDVYHTNIYARG